MVPFDFSKTLYADAQSEKPSRCAFLSLLSTNLAMFLRIFFHPYLSFIGVTKVLMIKITIANLLEGFPLLLLLTLYK